MKAWAQILLLGLSCVGGNKAAVGSLDSWDAAGFVAGGLEILQGAGEKTHRLSTQHSALSTQHSALNAEFSALSTQPAPQNPQHPALGTQLYVAGRGVLVLRSNGERVSVCADHSDCGEGSFCLPASRKCAPCSHCHGSSRMSAAGCPLDRCGEARTAPALAPGTVTKGWLAHQPSVLVAGAVGLIFMIPVQAFGTIMAVVFCAVVAIKIIQCLQHGTLRAALKHPRQHHTVARRRAQERLRAEQRLAAWSGPAQGPNRVRPSDPVLRDVDWVRAFGAPGRLPRAASNRMPWDLEIEREQRENARQREGRNRSAPGAPHVWRDARERVRQRREFALGRRAYSEDLFAGGNSGDRIELSYPLEMYPGEAEAIRESLESERVPEMGLRSRSDAGQTGFVMLGSPREPPPVSLPAHMQRNRESLPGQVEEREEIPEGQECAICMEKAQNAVLKPCGHGDMCFGCAEHLLSTTKQCPICRCEIRAIKQKRR